MQALDEREVGGADQRVSATQTVPSSSPASKGLKPISPPLPPATMPNSHGGVARWGSSSAPAMRQLLGRSAQRGVKQNVSGQVIGQTRPVIGRTEHDKAADAGIDASLMIGGVVGQVMAHDQIAQAMRHEMNMLGVEMCHDRTQGPGMIGHRGPGAGIGDADDGPTRVIL